MKENLINVNLGDYNTDQNSYIIHWRVSVGVST